MTKKTSMVLLAALVAGACSPVDNGYRWQKNGNELSENSPEAYECSRDARMAGATLYVGFGIFEKTSNQNVADACLRSKGYRYTAPSVAESTVDPNAPPTSMGRFAPGDMVWCQWLNQPPVRFSAQVCSQGRGYIAGPA